MRGSRLFVVAEVFAIKDRGVCVVGAYDDPKNARIFIGDEVAIRGMDGTTKNAVVSGLPMRPVKLDWAEVLLGFPITKDDVAPGDEIWSLSY